MHRSGFFFAGLAFFGVAGCGTAVADIECGPGTKLVAGQCVVDDDGMPHGDGGGGASTTGGGGSSTGPGGGGAGTGGAATGGSGGSGPCSDPAGIATGKLEVGPGGAVVPLCGGHVLVGDGTANVVKDLDLATGQATATYSLTAAPGDIVLDPVANKAYATLGSASFLARIDLATAQVENIPLEAPALRLALGNDGRIFASLDDNATWPNRPIALVDGPGGVVEATIVGDFDILLAFDRPGNQLIIGDAGTSPSSLNRFAFDPVAKTLTHLQERWDAGGNGQDIAISPDGDHLAFPCGGGNGAGYTVFDFSTDDLNVTYGEWATDAYPRAAAFSSDGAQLVATNGDDVILFDVANHQELAKFTIQDFGCSFPQVKRLSISPGGKRIHALVSCDFGDQNDRLFWFAK